MPGGGAPRGAAGAPAGLLVGVAAGAGVAGARAAGARGDPNITSLPSELEKDFPLNPASALEGIHGVQVVRFTPPADATIDEYCAQLEQRCRQMYFR